MTAVAHQKNSCCEFWPYIHGRTCRAIHSADSPKRRPRNNHCWWSIPNAYEIAGRGFSFATPCCMVVLVPIPSTGSSSVLRRRNTDSWRINPAKGIS